MNEEILIIGYGNELRGDDAIGPMAARTIAGWKRPGVRALAGQQLTPELAEAVSQAALVIFIDAHIGKSCPSASRLLPAKGNASWGHTSDPSWLLALAEAVFERVPPTWLVTIPAAHFGYGQEMSPLARAGLSEALALIEQIMDGKAPCEAQDARAPLAAPL